MTLDHRVRERLLAIEALLRETEHWQDSAPDSRAFASEQPFCLDTMEPLEWLQWVLIPRMHQLLESGMPLPQNFAVAPYYEMAWIMLIPCASGCLPSCFCWMRCLPAATPDAGDFISGPVAGSGEQAFGLAGAS